MTSKKPKLTPLCNVCPGAPHYFDDPKFKGRTWWIDVDPKTGIAYTWGTDATADPDDTYNNPFYGPNGEGTRLLVE